MAEEQQTAKAARHISALPCSLAQKSEEENGPCCPPLLDFLGMLPSSCPVSHHAFHLVPCELVSVHNCYGFQMNLEERNFSRFWVLFSCYFLTILCVCVGGPPADCVYDNLVKSSLVRVCSRWKMIGNMHFEHTLCVSF